ncbi:MAG: pyridoxal-phosphate-dependent aminotransferase family protein [Rhodothalassiaceae bacterium]
MPSFEPPVRHLMGPGPSDVPARVRQAMAAPTIGHLDPAFQGFMERLKADLRVLFGTANRMTFALSAPATAAMESCLANLLEPGETAVICRNGAFGGRLAEMARRLGAEVVTVDDEWGRPPHPDKVEAALAAHPEARVLAFVHAETSTGVRADAAALCRLARAHDCLTIVDTVTSLGGIEVAVDAWGADAVYAGSQKCLSCPPGLAPVTFSERAVERVKARRRPVASWFHDLGLIASYWDGDGGRSYHHTAPVNALYGLSEAVSMLLEEGLEAARARHQAMHQRLIAGLRALGLEPLVDEPDRLPQLNAIRVPDGVDEAAVRCHLIENFRLEIGAGLGPLAGRIWRIGLMGASACLENVVLCLDALENALAAQPVRVPRGAAVASALAVETD